MNILPQLTQEETDQTFKNALVIQTAEATQSLAVVLSNANAAFWAIPTDRLLAILNKDVAIALATFAANTNLATAVNDSLELVGLPRRAPVSAGRSDIVFDGTQFVYVAPEPVEY